MKKKKSNLLIDGKHLNLREIRLSDVNENYCKWLNDTAVNKYMESRFERWTIKKIKKYVGEVNNNVDTMFFAIIHKDKNKHIGNVKLGPINRIHNFADIGIMIGQKSFWGKGLATEAIRLVVNYAFKKLKIHKLIAGAYANNIGSITAFKKAGFFIEGIQKKQYLCSINYVDGVLLGIINKEYNS